MNPPREIRSSSRSSDMDCGENTLRLIASLPAPEGLADRVQAGLRSAPRTPTVLSWPHALRPAGAWTRGAAAAAIVFAVAGGGWGVYSRVQPPASARVITMPSPSQPSGGFSTGGARRVPQTLVGPVLMHPVTPAPADAAAQTAVTAHAAPIPTIRKKRSAVRHAIVPVH